MSTEISSAVLQAAIAATSTERPNTHGNADDNFAAIAELWNAYVLLIRRRSDGELSALDVAQMMVLFKMARTITGDPTCADHFIDQAGYTAVGARLAGVRMASAAADLQKVLEKPEPVQPEAAYVSQFGSDPVMPFRYTKLPTLEEAGLLPISDVLAEPEAKGSGDPAMDELNR